MRLALTIAFGSLFLLATSGEAHAYLDPCQALGVACPSGATSSSSSAASVTQSSSQSSLPLPAPPAPVPTEIPAAVIPPSVPVLEAPPSLSAPVYYSAPPVHAAAPDSLPATPLPRTGMEGLFGLFLFSSSIAAFRRYSPI